MHVQHAFKHIVYSTGYIGVAPTPAIDAASYGRNIVAVLVLAAVLGS